MTGVEILVKIAETNSKHVQPWPALTNSKLKYFSCNSKEGEHNREPFVREFGLWFVFGGILVNKEK